MSCVRCGVPDPYYAVDRQKEAQDTRDAAWKGPLGTMHKVGGYFLNIGILCVLAGMIALSGSFFSKVLGNLQMHQILSQVGIYSLVAFIPCIAGTTCLESLAIHRVKKIVCQQLGDGSQSQLPNTFQVNSVFACENAPEGENSILVKIMDHIAG